MFATLLIANRAEIACRVARTARRMGIRTVAVYSDADAQAQHVRAADAAVRIGAPPARESYLNVPAIIEAARRSGAEAVHPGYGFLSESAEFAEACAEAGLVFVGPPAEAIRQMGSKAAAKELVGRSGVPLLPGYHGENQEQDHLEREAARIGYPVVIKAVAGGGGRGMRVVRERRDFPAALAAARQEAQSAFGDSRVLVERYLDRPRHIEVQVFGDTQGNIVHLFERDCSTQRRHQKIIEEAPAPGIDPMEREALGQAAVAAARAVGYVGAGTVEFVADDQEFFFLEMNTRLQVEHPVTELVTGFDLVEWQLRIAAGEPLPATGGQIALRGHAMEARLYAEDPARDFAPATGRLIAFRMPTDIRVDTGYAEGDTIGVHYDAMLAKLIVHGTDREEARRKLLRTLSTCQVSGVTTNLALLRAIAAHPVFAAGAPDTGFVGREIAALLPARTAPPDAVAAAAAALLVEEREAAERAATRSIEPASPWNARDGWWLNAAPERVLELAPDRALVHASGMGWHIRVGEAEFEAEATHLPDGQFAIVLDGLRETAALVHLGTGLDLHWRGADWHFTLPDDPAAYADELEAGNRLTAPIPGQITDVLTEAGKTVAKGDTLVVLEAMKTVFRLAAPDNGTVARVACRPGDTVEEGQVLVEFAERDAPEPEPE